MIVFIVFCYCLISLEHFYNFSDFQAFPTQDGLQPSQMQTGICTKSPEKPSKVVGSTTGGSAVVSDAVEKPMAVSDKKTGKMNKGFGSRLTNV